MNLDEAVTLAIRAECKKEGLEECEAPIIRFLEKYLANEIPDQEIPLTLDGIYTMINSFQSSSNIDSDLLDLG